MENVLLSLAILTAYLKVYNANEQNCLGISLAFVIQAVHVSANAVQVFYQSSPSKLPCFKEVM